jgi:hypothetical protein
MKKQRMAVAPVLLLLLLTLAAAEPQPGERSALQSFLAGTPHERALGWNASAPACAWTGVTCDASNATVVELRLPGVGLTGRLAPGTLGQLRNLQVISLRSNRLSGDVPGDLFSLPLLRSLYLQGNLLTGAVVPAEAGRLPATLEHLALSHNDLSGAIPFALNNLTRLRSLRLDGNRLSGSLPSISIRRLEVFNVSYNDLNGSIPASLARFPADSFAGNLQLCGAPLLDRPCHPFFPSPAPSPQPTRGGAVVPGDESKKKKKKKLSGAAVVAIAVGAGAAALLALVLLVLCLVHHHRRSPTAAEDGSKAATAATRSLTPSTASGEMGGGEFTSSSKEISAGAATTSRLVLVGKRRGGAWQHSFDLEDLLRASAEVLGKGGLGTSYRATLEDGTTVVVKRLRDVGAARREFGACVDAAAAAQHRNLAPLRGYYYSKDEKLLVGDYLPAGSLSARLHGQSLIAIKY